MFALHLRRTISVAAGGAHRTLTWKGKGADTQVTVLWSPFSSLRAAHLATILHHLATI